MATTDPVYLRVLEDLRERIRGGLLPPGARVPSRNAIIARYGVGETAAKHALQVLATEGLIEARTGSGSYVRKLPPAGYLDHDRLQHPGSPFGLDEAAQDRPGSARRLSWEHQTTRLIPPPRIARRLGLEPGAGWVISTRYLLTADSEPVQLATSYEPEQVTAGTPVAVPEQGPLAGRGVIEVRPSLLAESAALGMPAGAPALVIERAHLASGRPVEAGEIVIAADRFRLRYRIPVPGSAGRAAPGPTATVPALPS
jgi:DNA-binding GntR family transcriptional regulator